MTMLEAAVLQPALKFTAVLEKGPVITGFLEPEIMNMGMRKYTNLMT